MNCEVYSFFWRNIFRSQIPLSLRWKKTQANLFLRDWSSLENSAIIRMSRVFAHGPEDQGSILGWVIPKTQKMVLDVALLNSQHYKVRIKGKMEQSREWSSALPNTSV